MPMGMNSKSALVFLGTAIGQNPELSAPVVHLRLLIPDLHPHRQGRHILLGNQ